MEHKNTRRGYTRIKRGGFTLIELLVVVLIIGILAAVAVPQYQKAVEKARLSEAVSTVLSLQKAIDLYVLTNGKPRENISFLGWADAQKVLDIDFDSFSSSKNFVYAAACSNYYCYVTAFRTQNGDPDGETEYSLATYNDEENRWINQCLYYKSTYPYGETLCKGLEGQGWSADWDE